MVHYIPRSYFGKYSITSFCFVICQLPILSLISFSTIHLNIPIYIHPSEQDALPSVVSAQYPRVQTIIDLYKISQQRSYADSLEWIGAACVLTRMADKLPYEKGNLLQEIFPFLKGALVGKDSAKITTTHPFWKVSEQRHPMNLETGENIELLEHIDQPKSQTINPKDLSFAIEYVGGRGTFFLPKVMQSQSINR